MGKLYLIKSEPTSNYQERAIIWVFLSSVTYSRRRIRVMASRVCCLFANIISFEQRAMFKGSMRTSKLDKDICADICRIAITSNQMFFQSLIIHVNNYKCPAISLIARTINLELLTIVYYIMISSFMCHARGCFILFLYNFHQNFSKKIYFLGNSLIG